MLKEEEKVSALTERERQRLAKKAIEAIIHERKRKARLVQRT
jgi:hypothetical protein